MRSIALYKHLDPNAPQLNSSSEQTHGMDASVDQEFFEEKDELHINIWKVQQGHLRLKPKLYIDFGIMTTFRTDKMCLYLPFQIVGIPKDLGKKLQDDRDMLCAVFNENLLNETQQNNCYSYVRASDNPEFFSFYLFQLGNGNMAIEAQEEENEVGTYINIKRNGWYDNQENHENTDFDNKMVYMRFRVEVKDIKEIVRSEFVSNDLFQAAFSKVDLYDIRVNETREIHPKVTEKMRSEGFVLCKFQKIHLFYMADSREKVENESSLKSDSRILEEGKWIDYEPSNDLHHTIFLAHHWKKRKKKDEKPIDRFSLFFSTIYPHMHWAHLTAFLCVIVILGWLGGMLEFDLGKINNDWKSWLRPAFIGLIFLFVVIYALALNYGFIAKIFRKR